MTKLNSTIHNSLEHLVYEIDMLGATARKLLLASPDLEASYEIYENGYLRNNAATTTSISRPIYSRPRDINTDRIICNALLESFCIHARNIYDLLYRNKKYPDDMNAVDYLDSSAQWLKIRPTNDGLEEDIKRVSKEVAHLTKKRIGKTLDDKKWLFIKIANQIGSVLDVFNSHISTKTVKEVLRNPIDNLLNLR